MQASRVYCGTSLSIHATTEMHMCMCYIYVCELHVPTWVTHVGAQASCADCVPGTPATIKMCVHARVWNQ